MQVRLYVQLGNF